MKESPGDVLGEARVSILRRRAGNSCCECEEKIHENGD